MPKRRKSARPPSENGLSNATEVLTVVWSMTVIMGLLCDAGTAIARLWFHQQPDAKLIGVLAGMLLLAAVVMGVLSMAMLPLVLKLRKSPPPPGFIVLAIIVAVAPLIAVFAEQL